VVLCCERLRSFSNYPPNFLEEEFLKTFIVALFVLTTGVSFADSTCDVETITKNYCDTIDWAEAENSSECPIEINSVMFVQPYKAGKKLEFYSTDVVFDENGDLFEITGNYMGGTGIDMVLVDAKSCVILDQTNVYSE
jgi:hypothetical protein